MSTLGGRRQVVAAAIVDDVAAPTQLLAARRTEPPQLAGGWEFPGGKVEPGEDHLTALRREVCEELGVEISSGDPVIGPLDGAWPLGEHWAMFVFVATITSGEPAPLEDHDQLRWVTPRTALEVAWLPDDLPVVNALLRQLKWVP